jgi:hypothetical protein
VSAIAGKFRDLRGDLSGDFRELLATETFLAMVLQYLTPFLACLVLFSFASATLLKACNMQMHATLSKAAGGPSQTQWWQVCV